MKRFLLFAALSIFMMTSAMGQNVPQKIGYVNTETILAAIPEYKVASEKLETLSNQYQEKIKQEYSKIETLYNNYQKQKATLSAATRQAKENEIITKEREVKKLQQSYFGQEGQIQKKSEELIGPIKEKVQKAIDMVAEKGGYMLIIDIATSGGVVYAASDADLSQQVIKIYPTLK